MCYCYRLILTISLGYKTIMTPYDDFVYLINSILLGEEPVSTFYFCYIINAYN